GRPDARPRGLRAARDVCGQAARRHLGAAAARAESLRPRDRPMYQAREPGLLPVMTSFADVVRARWHSLAEPDDPTSRLRYDAMREHFERTHGRIVAAHWSSREAAGVAICCRHLSYGRLQWSLHRSLGGLAAQRP